MEGLPEISLPSGGYVLLELDPLQGELVKELSSALCVRKAVTEMVWRPGQRRNE